MLHDTVATIVHAVKLEDFVDFAYLLIAISFCCCSIAISMLVKSTNVIYELGAHLRQKIKIYDLNEMKWREEEREKERRKTNTLLPVRLVADAVLFHLLLLHLCPTTTRRLKYCRRVLINLVYSKQAYASLYKRHVFTLVRAWQRVKRSKVNELRKICTCWLPTRY